MSAKVIQIDSEKLFEKINDSVAALASQFYIRRYLQQKGKENSSGYSMRPFFWEVIIPTLFRSSLLNTATMFDGETDDKKFSLYTYIQHLNITLRNKYLAILEEEKYKKIIFNLRMRRHKYLAHKEKLYVFNGAELTKKFPINYGEIEDILELLIVILDETKKEFDSKNATDYKHYYQDLEKRCKGDAEFVLKNGLNTPGFKQQNK